MADSKLNFVCAKCDAVNRVPTNRVADRPICAKCKSQLTTVDGPFSLSEETFHKFITSSSSDIVVDFWAPWCGPCRMMAPDFETASRSLSPKFIFAKVDTDESPMAAQPYNITGIPCVIVFRGGKELARQSGAMKSSQIARWLQSIS